MRTESLLPVTPDAPPTHREVTQLVSHLSRALLDGSACREILAAMPAWERALFERFAQDARRLREQREGELSCLDAGPCAGMGRRL